MTRGELLLEKKSEFKWGKNIRIQNLALETTPKNVKVQRMMYSKLLMESFALYPFVTCKGTVVKG